MLFFFLSLFTLIFNDFNLNILLYVLLLVYLNNYIFSKKNIILYKLSHLNQFYKLASLAPLFKNQISGLSACIDFFFKKLKWKPLFKRSSYFGIFRSSRNQWLNK